jgi:hypothetical protein
VLPELSYIHLLIVIRVLFNEDRGMSLGVWGSVIKILQVQDNDVEKVKFQENSAGFGQKMFSVGYMGVYSQLSSIQNL